MNKLTSAYVVSGIFVVVGTAGFVAGQPSEVPRLGPIPEEATRDGRLHVELVPEHVPAYQRDGQVAGYVKKEDLFDVSGSVKAQKIRVLDSVYLSRTVGFMVPDRGFVPLGVDERDVPTFVDRDESESDD